jgi:mono/diheme cytochrome c family protein
MLMLPEGRPDAGRDAFVALGCASCHTVAGDSDLPAPVSASLGPELGVHVATLGRGSIATSVIAPNHKVARKYRAATEGGSSPMADYSAVMTVRQLADIVAYIERQGLETRAKTGQNPR